MNYTPIITFRELNNSEKELIKNAESILKELGFNFTASSPYLDDREWKIELSDDNSKEMYIQLRDEDGEDTDPIIIIDDILTDKIQTIDGDSAYFIETEVTEENILDQSNLDSKMKELLNGFNETDIDIIKEQLKNNNEDLMKDIFKNNTYKLEKEFLIKDILKIGIDDDSDDEEKNINVINLLLNYINDQTIVDAVNQAIG